MTPLLLRSYLTAPFDLTGWGAAGFWLGVGATIVWLLAVTGTFDRNERPVRTPGKRVQAHDPDFIGREWPRIGPEDDSRPYREIKFPQKKKS